MQKQALMKQKVEAQEVDGIKAKLLGSGGAGEDEDKTVEQLLIDVDEAQDSALIRKLREWMRHRQELKREEEIKMLADTVIDLDSMTLKKLIIKLDNLEKALRELRRLGQLRGIIPRPARLEEQRSISVLEESIKIAKAPTPKKEPTPVKQAPPTPPVIQPPPPVKQPTLKKEETETMIITLGGHPLPQAKKFI
jgi:hypothetical protein